MGEWSNTCFIDFDWSTQLSVQRYRTCKPIKLQDVYYRFRAWLLLRLQARKKIKMSYKIVTKSDITVDVGVKNKFAFSWLERTIKLLLKISGKVKMEELQLRDFYQKVSIPGKALCFICDKLTSYGSRGCKALEQHAESSSHIQNLEVRKSYYTVKGMFGTGKCDPENVNSKIGPANIPMCDRIGNLEVRFYVVLCLCVFFFYVDLAI